MESIRELDNSDDDSEPTSPIETEPSTPTSKRKAPLQPFRASLQRQPSLASVSPASPARDQLNSALTECSPLLSKRSDAPRHQAPQRILKKPTDGTGQDPTAGGTILGIHNLSIVAPQFVVSLVAAAIFKLLEHHHEATARGTRWVSEPGPGDGLRGQNDVVWVLRFGGLASLVGVFVSRWVLPTRSEQEYREHVMSAGASESDEEPQGWSEA